MEKELSVMEIANLNSLITTSELPSKIELWIPISLAKSIALLATNISKAVIDEGNAIFSGVEAKTSPRESLIITPTPAEPSLSNRAPSKLVLKILAGGGFQGFLAGRRLLPLDRLPKLARSNLQEFHKCNKHGELFLELLSKRSK